MSLILEFVPYPGWNRTYTEREAAALLESDFQLYAFPCKLVFIVDDVDLSWLAKIPIIDYARSLFVATRSLSAAKPEARFISPDLEPWNILTLNDDDSVTIRRQGIMRSASVSREQLVRSAACMGIRAYNSFVAAYPAVDVTGNLLSWYPLLAMERTCSPP